MVPRLPYELIAMIAEMAHEQYDIRTLEACTLVSPTWRSASRRTVFRKIHVTDEQRLEALATLLSTDHSIRPLVRSLVFRADSSRAVPSRGWISKLPTELPTLLPNLLTLEFIGVREWFAPGDPPAAALSSFRDFTSVRRLVLHGCAVTPCLLSALSSALPSVSELFISYVHIPRRPPSPAAMLCPGTPRGPSLVALELDVGHIFSCALQRILAWLFATPSCATLRCLTLTLRASDAEAAGRFVQAVGPHLEELDLRFEEYFGLPLETANIKSYVSLKECTQLRSLTLFDPNPTSAAIRSSISEIRSQHLRSLTLWVSCIDASECVEHTKASRPRLLDFSGLEVALEGDNLKCLEELCFIYYGPMPTAEVEEALRAGLPGIASRGIIHVTRDC